MNGWVSDSLADVRGELAALKIKHGEAVTHAIRTMCALDDLAEAMAMALEDLLAPEGPGDMDPASVAYDNLACDAKVATATEAMRAWRAIRPTRGLTGAQKEGGHLRSPPKQ